MKVSSLKPVIENEQLLFKKSPSTFSMPYTLAERRDIFKLVSSQSFKNYPEKWESIKSFVSVNFTNRVGDIAPDFTLPTTEGEQITLSNYRGELVAFMFVAMTCPPARIQTERWQKMYEKYQGKGINFFLIYSRERHPGDPGYLEFKHPVNYEEKLSYAKLHAKLTDISVLVDTFDQEVLTLYGKVPNQCFVVNPKGYIAYKSGWANAEQVSEVLKELLSFHSIKQVEHIPIDGD